MTFGHDEIDNQYTKACIQFSSDGKAGEITFQLRYYGTQFNQNIKFLFYSWVVRGKENTNLNHNIFDLSNADDNHEILSILKI